MALVAEKLQDQRLSLQALPAGNLLSSGSEHPTVTGLAIGLNVAKKPRTTTVVKGPCPMLSDTSMHVLEPFHD